MANGEFEYVIDSSRKSLVGLRELWSYRELFYFFTWRDVKVKYKQTMLGFLWAILQPVLMMLIYTFFFGRALNIPSQTMDYPVFVFSGLLIWNIFSSGISNASGSMVNNSNIIKKIFFPRLIIPVSSILVSLFDFLMAFIVFVITLFFFKQPVSVNAIWAWPLSVMFAIIGTLGPGCLLAALNVKYRDFRYVIPFLIQLLFFITPVLYPISFLKYPVLQYVVAASPLYVAVELFRLPMVVDNNLPALYLVVSATSGILFLIVGLVYFKQTEGFFADLA
jgi:lipopolysaccharide transport system permease protein